MELCSKSLISTSYPHLFALLYLYIVYVYNIYINIYSALQAVENSSNGVKLASVAPGTGPRAPYQIGFHSAFFEFPFPQSLWTGK